jgi:hypothetical protein
MIHADATAFPDPHFANVPGMTKREYAAIHILAGLVGTRLREGAVLDGVYASRDDAVELAVDMADRLMRAL